MKLAGESPLVREAVDDVSIGCVNIFLRCNDGRTQPQGLCPLTDLESKHGYVFLQMYYGSVYIPLYSSLPPDSNHDAHL
jgi:hypothetical protein